ncbi:MAG: aldose epimerase [Blastochloris sp.]|nr:aldose epimerase [Blastochloris sp.]
MTYQGQSVIEIRNSNSRILLAPQHGGRLLLWELNGQTIIHWPDDADWSNPLKIRGGNPILFPFIARHFVNGELGLWQDAEGVVREMPMHGFARSAEFSSKVTDSGCVMSLEDSPSTHPFYPFRFLFEVEYILGTGTLEVILTTHNRSSLAMPYYAGHHFYFKLPRQDRQDWFLDLEAETYGRQNPDGSIATAPSPQKPLCLADPDLIDLYHIHPRSPHFRLHQRSAPRHISFELDGPLWHSVTSWTQHQDSDFYCVEPWLGLPNAIHHGQGLRWLEPGKKESARLLIRC